MPAVEAASDANFAESHWPLQVVLDGYHQGHKKQLQVATEVVGVAQKVGDQHDIREQVRQQQAN